jgi:glucose/mannose transport system permease protein
MNWREILFSDRMKAVLVIIPSLIALAIFVYGFIAWTGYTSLTDAKLSTGPGEFIGLENYTDLFTGLRFERFRTIFLFPMALSFVVTGVVWRWLFHPTRGLNTLPTVIGQPPGQFEWFISQERWFEFNWQDLGNYISVTILLFDILLVALLWRWNRRGGQMPGFAIALLLFLNTWLLLQGPQQITALSRPEDHGFNLAIIAVVIAAGWQMIGYTMAMYLAGLRGIPEDLREAARVDGASEWGVYRYVVLPLLAPITLSAMIVLGHISLKIFDLVYAMGGGDNPYIAMPGVNMFFTAFRGDALGRGAAIAMILLIMVAFVIIPYLRSSLRSEQEL